MQSAPRRVREMKKLLSTYRKTCGKPFPIGLLAEHPVSSLVPLDGQPLDKSLLIGSTEASRKPSLIQGDISEYLKKGPKGYFLVGYWGYGVNSYAFYFARINSWSRVFFRLPYGGAYGDRVREGLLVGQFLESVAFYEMKLREMCRSLIAVDSMGKGYYKVINKDGTSIELNESLFRAMDIGIKLGC
jgi:hypothetical protein